MGDDRLPDDMLLSEDQVRDFIERAALVQPRPLGTSVAELREIADELDIDPMGFNQALDQV